MANVVADRNIPDLTLPGSNASVFLGQALSVTLQRHNVRALLRHRKPDNLHIEDDPVPVV